MPAHLRRPIATLLLVSAVLVAHRGVLELAMLGWDGWPLVAAARVESPGDLAGTFTERLMDGRYPHGDFYRPITHLAFALDAATSGLEPRGYHRTDLALLAADTLLVAAVGARLAGGWAGLVAGLVYGLHPIQLELLAVPARRADLLAIGFALACLLVSANERGTRPRAFATGLLALLAAGSKETGVFVVPAAIGWHFVLAEGALRARLAAAARRSAPVLAGGLVYVAARTAVLGGLGGHTGELGPPASTAELLRGLVAGVLYPEPILGRATPALLAGLTAILLAGALAAARGGRPPRRGLVASGWIALSVLLVTSLAERLHAWYAATLAAPYAMALGTVIAHGARRIRSGARIGGGIALAAGAALAAGHVLASSLVRPYPRLRAASDWLEERYGELERVVSASAPGEVVRINPWPVGVPPRPDGGDVESLALATDYTVAAWLELRFPDRRFEVSLFDGGRPSPRPGVTRVQLVPAAPPGWVEEAR